MASSGCRANVDVMIRNSLMKMPNGGMPAMAIDAQHEAPAEHRMALGQAADLGDLLRALGLGDVADGEEDRRLGQAVHGHVQQAGEARPAVRPCRRRR